jgi:hypothetical protein
VPHGHLGRGLLYARGIRCGVFLSLIQLAITDAATRARPRLGQLRFCNREAEVAMMSNRVPTTERLANTRRSGRRLPTLDL